MIGSSLSFFIRSKSNHRLPLSITYTLTHCCLVDLIDVTLACEDANSKLVDVVPVADFNDEERIGNSLVEILTLKIVQDIEAEVWSRFWSWSLVKILRQKFGRDFVVKDWSTFWARSLIKILKLNFDQPVTWLQSSYFGGSRQPVGLLCLSQSLWS